MQFYTKSEQLGAGGYGKVHLVTRLQDGKRLAMKHLIKQKDADTLLFECSLSKMLGSPYITECVEVFKWNDKLSVIFELLEEGDLTNLPRSKNEKFYKYTMYCVAKGIEALHTKNILHRDIKAENILHRKNGDIKLTDLGLSVFLTSEASKRKT